MRLNCPSCMKAINAPDGVAGKRVRCPGCGNAFRVPQSTAIQSAPAPSLSPVIVEPPPVRQYVQHHVDPPHANISIETRSADSASGRGFGWGFGLTLGVLFALVLVFCLVPVGVIALFVSVTEMGANASRTFNSVAKDVGTSSPAPRQIVTQPLPHREDKTPPAPITNQEDVRKEREAEAKRLVEARDLRQQQRERDAERLKFADIRADKAIIQEALKTSPMESSQWDGPYEASSNDGKLRGRFYRLTQKAGNVETQFQFFLVGPRVWTWDIMTSEAPTVCKLKE